MALRQCPKRFWLEIHRPALRIESTAAEARFEAGHHVGEIARRLYDPMGEAVMVDVEGQGFAAAIQHTSDLLQAQQPVFEAGFAAGGALAFADVMLPSGEQPLEWRMVEVKSSTRVKPYHCDDVAVQAYVARTAGVRLSGVAVACIDSSWTYPGGGDYRGLLHENDLTQEALAREEEVKCWIDRAQTVSALDQAPEMAVGPHCDDPFECGFYGHCNQHESQATYPIHWLPRRGARLKQALDARQITDMRDVPDDLLNPVQQRVKHHTLTDTVYFDSTGAAEDLAAHPLPAQFLDFETIQFAVPIWAGTRPYQQIPFQYSLHTLMENGEVLHGDFLTLDGEDPSRRLAMALVADCGDRAWPIFAYNAGFEKSRLRELALRFPEHAAPLLAIVDRVVDLLPIARERYYHPSQKGSWSIKAVLPAAVPALRYSDLAGVQDGGMAMDAYLEAIHPVTSLERVEIIRRQLLAYCQLDTYAMVRLWQVFNGHA
ncbi:DUF2779 domain-containing protein [Hydrogenophaga palleronii]|uniref:DUF2779 domain-containing protein n=1 Tax=Hydrogenophaga palleronii TaxID=65655 RepID=UPI001FDF2A98|nr:DUF2779 domain-containing protein [Hydrogenophaga palleronii]